MDEDSIQRCHWCNNDNSLYVSYHDKEWSLLTDTSDHYLFELLLLEMFQAGLSWQTILNKRESFRKSFDNFNYLKIQKYDEKKINSLLENKDIVRNKKKIEASINNAKVFIKIIEENGSFIEYLRKFTGNNVIYEYDKTQSEVSDALSKDLKKQGMKFVGSITIYSYLQAIGLIYSHEKNCFLNKKHGKN